MPKVCIYRPNRTTKRHFTESDVARIAKYAIRDGANPERILGVVLVAAGLAASFKLVCEAMSLVALILRALGAIGAGLAIGKIIELLANFGFYAKFIPLPAIRAAAVVAALVAAFLGEFIPNVEQVERASAGASFARRICDYINSIGG